MSSWLKDFWIATSQGFGTPSHVFHMSFQELAPPSGSIGNRRSNFGCVFAKNRRDLNLLHLGWRLEDTMRTRRPKDSRPGLPSPSTRRSNGRADRAGRIGAPLGDRISTGKGPLLRSAQISGKGIVDSRSASPHRASFEPPEVPSPNTSKQ